MPPGGRGEKHTKDIATQRIADFAALSCNYAFHVIAFCPFCRQQQSPGQTLMLSALPSRILDSLAFLLVYITRFIYFSLSLLYSVLSVLYLLRRLFPLVYILRLGIYPPYKSPLPWGVLVVDAGRLTAGLERLGEAGQALKQAKRNRRP